MTANGSSALGYARKGWAVFPTHNPIQPGGRGPLECSCRKADCASPAKHPRTPNGLKAATTDVDQVHAWWQQTPHAGVAIRTGAASGLLVVDVDPRHGGDTTWAELQREYGKVPDGRTVRTGSGGAHHYFAHPGGTVPNTAGRLGPGVDTRGDGGYVLAPPTKHISGGRYVLGPFADRLPDPPDWLLAALREPERSATPPAFEAPKNASRWGRAALSGELDKLRQAPQGTRNDTLNRVAYRLGQIIASGVLTEHDVTGPLHDQAVAAGLSEREVTRTLLSGLRAGEAHPSGQSSGEGRRG